MKTDTARSPMTRHPLNPILSSRDIPYDASLVFNAGVCKWQGEYVMLFRNDYGSDEVQWRAAAAEGRPYPGFSTNIGIARSRDGIRWTPGPKPVFALHDDEILRVYDPRLSVVEGRPVLCFAMDTRHGLRGGIATTEDFERFDILSLSAPDNRNMALFPERIGGRYVRLERPMPVYSRYGGPEQFDIWLSESPDLRFWGDTRLVLGAERVPFANSKIGPAAPPVRTPKGWLATFHAVRRREDNLRSWEREWHKEYVAGLMLLDSDDPAKIVGMAKEPLLVAEEPCETDGFRGSVIFPGGMLLEPDGEVKIYYGAADTVECLATAHVDDLLALCESV